MLKATSVRRSCGDLRQQWIGYLSIVTTFCHQLRRRYSGDLTLPRRLMASKTKPTPRTEPVPQEEDPAPLPDQPLLDLSDAVIKKLIQAAKKRGYVTHDQINSVLRSEEVNSEQIEDILAMFSEMGVNVVETEEASDDDEHREEAEEEGESERSELVELQRAVPAKSETKEPTERTDDPVRMYLREMGSVELLSREGEIAIAKRIEAGREAMIDGLEGQRAPA